MDSSTYERKVAYFHSLGKVMTEANQNIYESRYKSSHTVKTNEIWTDAISFASTYTDAKNESIINSSVTNYINVPLDQIYGSNGQSYSYIENGFYYDNSYPIDKRGKVSDGGIYIRPFIAPEDVVNKLTNEISNGYRLRLYRGDDATSGTPGSEIFITEGNWVVNYYSGIVSFQEEYTPKDLGWGSIKASFFQYTGKYVSDVSDKYFNSAVYENNNIVFNKNTIGEARLDLSTLQITETITNIQFNPSTKKLAVNRYDGNNYEIDLSPLSDVANGVSDVTYDSDSTILTFFKNGKSYLSLDLNDIILNVDNSFVDSKVDLTTNQLIFTRANGTTDTISLTELQDRSAYNDVYLDDSMLLFKKQNGDLTTIDLSLLMINTGITDVQFDESTNILSFYKEGLLYNTIDLQSIINDFIIDNNSFVDVIVDEINGLLKFRKVDGTYDIITIASLQDRTAYNDAILEDNILTFKKQNGDLTTIDLSTIINNETGLTDVTFDNTTNTLIFYKEGVEYISVDLETIIKSFIIDNNSFIDANVDEVNGLLKFTKTDGTYDTIEIVSLQDRTAYNDGELEGSILTLRKQNGDLTLIDFSGLNVSGETSLSTMLSIEESNRIARDLYLEGLITEINSTDYISKISTTNINMSALNTTTTNRLACITPLLSGNSTNSGVLITINGLQAVLGNDEACECYFSDDGGRTKKVLTNIKMGDLLYWNYFNSKPVSGYDLGTVDKITFTYLHT